MARLWGALCPPGSRHTASQLRSVCIEYSRYHTAAGASQSCHQYHRSCCMLAHNVASCSSLPVTTCFTSRLTYVPVIIHLVGTLLLLIFILYNRKINTLPDVLTSVGGLHHKNTLSSDEGLRQIFIFWLRSMIISSNSNNCRV